MLLAWPLETSVGEPLVKQDVSVPGPVQCPDAIRPAAAEVKQTFPVQMTAELLGHDSIQTGDSEAKVGMASGE